VHVHVIGDARTGGAPHVRPDIETFRSKRASQHVDCSAYRAHEVRGLVVVEVLETGDVGLRGDDRVPRVVRELVHDHDRVFGPPHDQLSVLVVWVLDHAAEQAAGRLLLPDVLHPPRRPQMLH